MAAWKSSKYVGLMIFSIFLTVSCERTKDKMYKSVSGAFCFKRLTATNEYGCTSSRSGDTGVLHFVTHDNDIHWLLDKADAGPYVVILSFNYFKKDQLLKLKDSEKVSGIVLTSNFTAESFSPDDSCPNRYSGLDEKECDATQPWNPDGNSLMFVDWGFPIVYINSKDTLDFLYKCFVTHNAHDLDKQSTRSLCSLELTAHMLAAVDSRTCIRRSNMANNLTPTRYCDPLGDWSIYQPLYPRIANSAISEPDRSVVLLIARLDGSSMFDGEVPGAVSPVTGIVSLLTTAYYLSKITSGTSPVTGRNVVLMLLNGESYDYIGSSRVVYEMQNGAFPYQFEERTDVVQSPLLKLKHVGLVVELDQITSSSVFYHTKNTPDNSKLKKEFVDALKNEFDKSRLKLSDSIGKLPPASVQRFVKADSDIEGVVLGNYDRQYVNQFYHSLLDSSDKIDYTYLNGSDPSSNSIQASIAQVSLAIAKALYSVLQNQNYSGELSPDPKLVDELLHCYLDTMACDFFQKVTYQMRFPDRPSALYVGVNVNNNTITTLTGQTLAWLAGNHTMLNMSECVNNESDWVYQHFWVNGEPESGGVCIKTLMNYTLASSPAFDIEDYDWHSNNYSSWTESIWRSMTARVFLKPSKQHEALTISLGLVVLVFSFVIVYFINKKANILFNNKVLGSGGC